MKKSFFVWSLVMIVCLSVTGLGIRSLAVRGVPLSESLVLRGLVCLLLVLVWAYYRNMSLIPRSVATQFFRAVVAGLALSFFSLSYNWLSASTVSVLSNVDVPMIVILGSFVGQASSAKAKWLSFVSIALLVLYGLTIQTHPHWIYGLATLGIGLFLLCFGYYFIKKSMNEENRAITVLTPSIAIIVYGLFQKAFDGPLIPTWDAHLILVCIVSGIGMFGAYYATMKLYAVTDIATAEFPTLISSVVILPIEAVLFKEPLNASQIAITLVFIGIIYLILNNDKSHAY